SLPPSAYVKAIRLGATDVLSLGVHINGEPRGPLEIVIGTDGATLEGRVVRSTNDTQEPVRNATVVLAPDIQFRGRSDLYKNGLTDNNGRFQFTAIPPGIYKIFSWEDVDGIAWRDPNVIQKYDGRGQAVDLSKGNKGPVDVTVIPPI